MDQGRARRSFRQNREKRALMSSKLKTRAGRNQTSTPYMKSHSNVERHSSKNSRLWMSPQLESFFLLSTTKRQHQHPISPNSPINPMNAPTFSSKPAASKPPSKTPFVSLQYAPKPVADEELTPISIFTGYPSKFP